MVTPRALVIGGTIFETWFARMLSSRESLLLFLRIPFLAPPLDVDCISSFETHIFSTYLKHHEQVKYIHWENSLSKLSFTFKK